MVILGSTGSIGVNAQKIAKQFCISIEALACGGNVYLFNEQIKACKPKFIAIADETKLDLLQPQDSVVFVGDDGICAMLDLCKSDKILNAVIGYAGLRFSLKTLDLGKKLILANKESLVIAGHLIEQKIYNKPNPVLETTINHSENTMKQYPANNDILDRIFPIDSEHFSLWSLLALDDYSCTKPHTRYKAFQNLYITASGGALRDLPLDRIRHASLHDVLQHPTWSMGQKITIDSATLVNKLYEILEAHWLFHTKNIHAIIERSSIIHAFVEYPDNSLCAYASHADMCLPLAYGIDRLQAMEYFRITKLCIQDLLKIDFKDIDTTRYPLWTYKDLLLEKPHLGIALNASNELLQMYFLQEKLPFFALSEVSMLVLDKMSNSATPNTLDSIIEYRNEAILLTNFYIKNLKQK